MPRRAAPMFSEGLTDSSRRGSRGAMATREGRVTEGSLREGAPAERVEEPAAVGERSRTADAGLTSACSPSLRCGASFGFRCQPFPPPGGGLASR